MGNDRYWRAEGGGGGGGGWDGEDVNSVFYVF